MLAVHLISLKKIKRKAVLFANYEAMEKVYGRKILSKNYPILFVRLLTLVLIIFSVTGTILVYEDYASSYDFVLAIDASASMLATDYHENRLDAAREAAVMFVDYIPGGTKVGVLSFAGDGFVEQELSIDKARTKMTIESLDIKLAGGTAIGSAIVDSVNLLLSGNNSKSLVLITDGESNVGRTIEEAISYAKKFNVKIDTIGIGTEEGGMVGNTTIVAHMDAETLSLIAEQTGGRFYMPRTNEELQEAYKKIAAETRKTVFADISSYLMLVAMVIFIAELVLVNSKYRTIP